ncbi:uncharacterized protein LOC103981425 isoform X3 [Musa acuminata AAA Group]|uniref:uncharacterized protein LOC103981425 isoform X3 n=1 Tax=Musa acuminata AAA Group TaxID=214697 RepID=UPI0031D20965
MDPPQGSPQSSPDAQGSRQRPMDASQGLRQPLMDIPQGSRQPRQQQYQPRRPDPPSGGDSIFNAVVTIFLFVLVVVLLVSSSTTGSSLSILHQVPEGHVGVYWRGGALLEATTDPGFHWKLPLITQFEPIQVTIQTDQVRDIPCGTKGGVMISFDKIEVVNRLRKSFVYQTLHEYGVYYDKTWIYDKIHHEINQFCSAHSLQQVYIDMFDQALIAIEKQKVAEKEAETQKKIALSEAEKIAQVSQIQMEQKLMEKNSAKRQEEIENEMYIAREKSQADANFYRVMKEAEANRLKLTPEFLELKFIEAIANNSKIFFGEKVPNMVMDQRLLGNYLDGISKKGRGDV